MSFVVLLNVTALCVFACAKSLSLLCVCFHMQKDFLHMQAHTKQGHRCRFSQIFTLLGPLDSCACMYKE